MRNYNWVLTLRSTSTWQLPPPVLLFVCHSLLSPPSVSLFDSETIRRETRAFINDLSR